MRKVYIKVLGMTCDHCRHTITHNIENLNGINYIQVDVEQHRVELIYDEVQIEISKILGIILDLGYETSEEMVFQSLEEFHHAKRKKWATIGKTFLAIFLVYFLIKRWFGFDLLNAIPEIDRTISLPLLFGIGLMTSIHCVGMCGAFNMAANMGLKTKRSYRRPLLYNLGRVLSYTITGGIAGLVGQVLAPNTFVQGILLSVAAVAMLVIGLSQLGIISKKFIKIMPFPKRVRTKTSSPFLIGVLNGLMPCGPLQAMQLYAISTASFLMGAASMFLFALGTVPLMFLIGYLFQYLKGKRVYMMQRIGAALVVVLSVVMMNRATGYLGINIAQPGDHYEVAEINDDGYQSVTVEVKGSSYQAIMVQEGIPLKLNFHVDSGMLNGCNNPVVFPIYDITKKLVIGENVMMLEPLEIGTYEYRCWMSMIRSQIIVVEDLSNYV